jgi:hypothetical protein
MMRSHEGLSPRSIQGLVGKLELYQSDTSAMYVGRLAGLKHERPPNQLRWIATRFHITHIIFFGVSVGLHHDQ